MHPFVPADRTQDRHDRGDLFLCSSFVSTDVVNFHAGVLLLNACLTVRAHNANSHANKGSVSQKFCSESRKEIATDDSS